jgi:hypothetical protein
VDWNCSTWWESPGTASRLQLTWTFSVSCVGLKRHSIDSPTVSPATWTLTWNGGVCPWRWAWALAKAQIVEAWDRVAGFVKAVAARVP